MCQLLLHTLTTQCVVHGPGASISPGGLLEMQNLRLYFKLNKNLHFNKVPGRVVCTFKSEQPCSNRALLLKLGCLLELPEEFYFVLFCFEY